MIKIQDLINNDKSDIKMILQVHDELIFEVPADFTDEDIKPIISIMEETTKISVPLKVEYGFGKQTLPTSTATNILQGRKKSKKRKLDSTSLSLPSSSSSSSGTNLLAVKKKVKVQAVVQGI